MVDYRSDNRPEISLSDLPEHISLHGIIANHPETLLPIGGREARAGIGREVDSTVTGSTGSELGASTWTTPTSSATPANDQ